MAGAWGLWDAKWLTGIQHKQQQTLMIIRALSPDAVEVLLFSHLTCFQAQLRELPTHNAIWLRLFWCLMGSPLSPSLCLLDNIILIILINRLSALTLITNANI